MKYLLPIVCSVFLIGCGDSSPTEAPAAPQTEQAEAAVSDTATEMATPAVETETVSAEALSKPMETPAPAPAPAPAAEAKPVPAKTVAAPTAETKPAPVKTVAAPAIDGAAIFGQKCASCHGMKAEKSALGKSQVIAGWSSDQIKEALKGYQAGTYGKEMKALMQGQAKALDNAQIDALAKHIAAL